MVNLNNINSHKSNVVVAVCKLIEYVISCHGLCYHGNGVIGLHSVRIYTAVQRPRNGRI